MEAISDSKAEPFLDQKKRVEVHLGTDFFATNFWLGIYKPRGSHRLLDLFKESEWQEALDLAAQSGLAEVEDVFFASTEFASDCSSESARYAYLAPAPQSDFRSIGLWAERMGNVVERFHRREIGIYLSPGAVEDHRECLETLLKKLANDSLVEKFHLLSGKHGINHLFQAALGVKADLSELEYLVFH